MVLKVRRATGGRKARGGTPDPQDQRETRGSAPGLVEDKDKRYTTDSHTHIHTHAGDKRLTQYFVFLCFPG